MCGRGGGLKLKQWLSLYDLVAERERGEVEVVGGGSTARKFGNELQNDGFEQMWSGAQSIS